MRKALAAGLAALTFGTAMAASALPAEAAPHYRGYYRDRHHNGDVAGAAIVAGIAGLALGSALSSNHNNAYYGRDGYYDRSYYGRSYSYAPSYGYYEPGYGYYGQPRVCESSRWVYDRWAHRRVLVRSTYAC